MIWRVIVGTAVIGITYYWLKNQKLHSIKNNRIETLKNALLAFALNSVRSDDFDGLNMNYKAFDGTKLPSMSGFNLNNAFNSYIISKDDLRKSPFYSKVMEDKTIAIEKYLEKQFDTDIKVKQFLSDVINMCTPKKNENSDITQIVEPSPTTKEENLKVKEEDNTTTEETNKTKEENNNNSVDDFIVVKEHSI